ncbi:TPA: hypothetical protein NGR42_004650 [Vibrio parahaemolyticus]|uniref:hypothetical protein n=1 Tax=Vibrio parahaemolyticus TaxID=670 RepID=UPI001121CC35|nr:hypothetical protein [Vibrio parahaemolyticus]TOJ42525.1 hypothetical protein CGI38_23440 [Vibrio parahaemolyticus]HCE3021110.1 hypothetical protein [Vibrio parahaemolyticus]HCE4480167.1 hypothetical protein [Vibrio parahaemolyticus]
MEYIWWEKTVEYLFVQEHIPNSTLYTPLDGRHELASDGILFNGNSWILIEFKAQKTDIATERRKFSQYDECMKRVIDRASHHYFIFGQINEKDELELVSCKYFGDSQLYPVKESLRRGAEPSDFINYLIDLIECKKQVSDLKKTIDYSAVLGISNNGKITSCLTIDAYLNQVEANLMDCLDEATSDSEVDSIERDLEIINRALHDIEHSPVRFRSGLGRAL